MAIDGQENSLSSPASRRGGGGEVGCGCGHPAADHYSITVCDGLIHYPDEDAPCSCEEFKYAAAEECARCGHPRALHRGVVQCRPRLREVCGCVRAG